MSDIKLTDEQKELVENNHNLIYAYINKRNLNIDEYYDIFAISLCNAARLYNGDKGKFSTFAYKCMDNDLNKYCGRMKNKSMIPENIIVSYDAQDVRDDPDNTRSFLENFSDYESYNDMVYDTMICDIDKLLNDCEKEIFELMSNGLNQSEIAYNIGCKKQSVGYHVNNIRNKVINYLYN